MRELLEHAELSRRFGANPRYVLLGGGNTSYKTEDALYIKPSGVALAQIEAKQFVGMDRGAVRRALAAAVPGDCWEREATVKARMAAAVMPGHSGRPSVETPLHEIIDYRYVYHMHPALVNGMTCAEDGPAVCAELFPDALWIGYVDPGYTLASEVDRRLREWCSSGKAQPQVVFLQNHGVFVGSDSLGAIEPLYGRIMATLERRYDEAGIPTTISPGEPDPETVADLAPVLRTLLGSAEARAIIHASGYFPPAAGPLSPDHIVYGKSYAYSGPVTAEGLGRFEDAHGYRPKVAAAAGKATFAGDVDLKNARGTMAVAMDAALVERLTHAFGGPRWLDDREREFIENWEVESYRRKVATGADRPLRLQGKVVVVTGAAQGFGLGIAKGMAAEGAIVVLADLNRDGAATAAAGLEAELGSGRALAVGVDIADEDSVALMVAEVTRECGGLDVLVANAGVLRAGSVKELSKKDWDFVTGVNYSGYFLCVKYASRAMARQSAAGEGPWMDIIQINSKSGLEGSNRNAPYSGGKFGAIGLTQSFAKELVEDRIKVNSICPGNFFDGPLWSDPRSGLFAQYLRAGKVPGAETVQDVRRFYESKVPMGRGCGPDDVLRAILYVIEQQYETGQAVPVTGGQVMLN